MAKKLMRKSRTGSWVVVTAAALIVGAGVVANSTSTNNGTTVENKGKAIGQTTGQTSKKLDDKVEPSKNSKSVSISDTAKDVIADTARLAGAVKDIVEVAKPAPAVNVAAPANKPTETTNVNSPTEPNTGKEQPAKPVETPVKPVEQPAKPAKPVETPVKPVEQPAKPVETPVKPVEQPAKPVETPVKPVEQPAKPVETPVKPVEQPAKPVDKTTVISHIEKPAEIPAPIVTPGGQVKPVNTNTISSKPIEGEKPATPVDKPASQGVTNTAGTPGAITVVTPEVPAVPEVPAKPAVTDEDGTIITPEVPAVPGKPAVPAVTTRTDIVTDTTVINFGITYVKDTSLPSGATAVLTPGVNGSRTVVTNVTYTNSVETGRAVVSDTTVDAVSQVVAYNDEPVSLREEIQETLNTITFATERRATTVLKVGQTRVVQKGVDGQSKTTAKYIFNESGVTVSTEDLGTVVIAEPVTEIIEYGVSPVEVTDVVEHRETQDIDFVTETRNTDELYKGETRVVRKGVKGYQVVITKVTTVNGAETAREITNGDRVEPISEIVEVGTKDRVEVKTETVTEDLDFKSETRETDQLTVGQKRVVQKGVKGQRVIKRTTTITNGVAKTVDEVVSETAATNEIIEVGTRPETSTSHRDEVEVIKFNTVTRQNSSLKKGERRVVVKGVNGRKVTRITTTTTGNVSFDTRDVIENTPAIDEVVEIGTKEDIRTEMRVEREDLQVNTITRKTDKLFEGETRVVSEGKAGKKVTTYKDTYVDGVKVGSEVVGEPVIIEAEDRVIEIGTRPVMESASVTTTEVVNFKHTTENTDELEVGQTRIKRNGTNGSRVVKVTRTTNNRTGEVTETREVLSETPAVDEILLVGTRPKAQEPSTPAENPLLSKSSLTIDEFMSLSEADQDKYLARTGTRVTGINFDSQKDLNKVEQTINLETLNRTLVDLINGERSKLGLAAVTYGGLNSDVQAAATTRANEMADYGSLRYQNTQAGAHKRPDGSNWSSVYTAEQLAKMGWRGENALQIGESLGVKQAANEVVLAQNLFNQWMNSDGHRAVMMRNETGIEVAVGIGFGAKAYDTTLEDGVTVAMLELLTRMP